MWTQQNDWMGTTHCLFFGMCTPHPDCCILYHRSMIYYFTVVSHFIDFYSGSSQDWSPWQLFSVGVFAWQTWLENVSHDVFSNCRNANTVICLQFLRGIRIGWNLIFFSGSELHYLTLSMLLSLFRRTLRLHRSPFQEVLSFFWRKFPSLQDQCLTSFGHVLLHRPIVWQWSFE